MASLTFVVIVTIVGIVRIAACQYTNYKAHMTDSQMTRTFQMRVEDDFLKAIDDWRRGQEDLPSRSEAIRRLVAIALESERKG